MSIITPAGKERLRLGLAAGWPTDADHIEAALFNRDQEATYQGYARKPVRVGEKAVFGIERGQSATVTRAVVLVNGVVWLEYLLANGAEVLLTWGITISVPMPRASDMTLA